MLPTQGVAVAPATVMRCWTRAARSRPTWWSSPSAWTPIAEPGWEGAPLPDRPLRSHTGRVAVLGAGHTGASAAACLAGRGTPVDLFAPGGLVTCSTDVEPGWLGPKYLRGFAALPPEARRVALRDARLGTTTPATAARLREQEQAGLVRLLPERATALEVGDGRLRVATARSHGPYAKVYEATGYRVDVKHLPWLAPHVPRACEGLPVLDHDLRAAPGLHLLGPLAELAGPPGATSGARRGQRNGCRRRSGTAATQSTSMAAGSWPSEAGSRATVR